MDQLPRGNEGFANNNLFEDSQQYNAYDNLFQPGTDQNSYDASWGVNASNYPASSRAPHATTPNWPQHANHLSAASTHVNLNGQASPYARSMSHSPATYGQNPFNYGAQQNFPYPQAQYDPTLVPPQAFRQGFNYPSSNFQAPNSGTIAPHALEHDTRSPSFSRNPYEGSDYSMSGMGRFGSGRSFATDTVDQRTLVSAIPNGNTAGYFSIINFNDLSKSTKSERMGDFVNIGTEALNWDVNRAALPTYVPRKSRRDLRGAAGNDPKLLAKLGKKTLKAERVLNSGPRPLQSSMFGAAPGSAKIKYEGDSSSEEESSSEDEEDSSYTSDDTAESSPLPLHRPQTPKEATEYDTIKALWRGKRKGLNSDSIRKGLVDFWEIIKTIRDRWKVDSTAVTEAESKNRANELPLLKSRVKDQREMMESAFKAALKHGDRDIIELFSENAPLLYVCYQFLLERAKAEDYNSALPRVMLETMTLFSTMSDDKLEKTHLVKVLPRFVKKGDAKTQFYARKVISNAAAVTKKQEADLVEKKAVTKDAKPSSTVSKRVDLEPVAGVKRAATTTGEGGLQKKLATGTGRQDSTVKQSALAKKQTAAVNNTKPTTAPTTKPKQVVAKPSGLFSSLQSAAKKPGTSNASKASQTGVAAAASKASAKPGTISTQTSAPTSTWSFMETMANLTKPKEEKPAVKQEQQVPSETPEEKTKRLRKESRRHLHVTFKKDDDLVQVHLFHHDPEEELGHDASQVRDVGDVGGEGRMFKQQHQMMDIEDEDEAVEEDGKLCDFYTPVQIDFSDLDKEERKRNYAPYGGGEVEPESKERAVREYYEANNLMVFYADPNDVPPNPREPSDPTNGARAGTIKKFAAPEEKYAKRARQSKGSRAMHQDYAYEAPMGTTVMPNFDVSNLSRFGDNRLYPQTIPYQPPAPPPPPSNDAISNILASLKQVTAGQPAPRPPTMGGYGNAYAAAAPNMSVAQTQPPPGQPDLAAILAQITQNQTGAAQPAPGSGFNYNNPSPMPNVMGYNMQAQQSSVYENPERKQWRDGGPDNMSNDKRPWQNPGQNPYFRTKVCKYWQEGKCQKGDFCTYKHEDP